MQSKTNKAKYYEDRATLWAERYGIVEYRIRGNKMIYNVSFPKYLCEPRYTVQHTVNLNTFEESTKQLGRYDPNGVYNRG